LKACLFDANQLNRLIIRALGFGGESMPEERRRTPRYPFVADTEVRDDASGTTVKTRTRELSLYGCYVDMDNPFPAGTPITIKINTAGRSLEGSGKVVYSTANDLTCDRPDGSGSTPQAVNGIGVAFLDVSVQSRIVLKEWLVEAARAKYGPDPKL